MAVSNIVAIAIMMSTAATLHAQGKTDITTAADAAEALRPIAGDLAFALFRADFTWVESVFPGMV
jgi:Mn2+/Fe2+ NRAMP family transporter